jgi:hypothetical protein
MAAWTAASRRTARMKLKPFRVMVGTIGIAVLMTAGLVTAATPVAAAGPQYHSWFTFVKGSAPMGTLYWTVQRVSPDPPVTVVRKSWTAGSGTGSSDECYSNHGWLPDGTYSVTLHPNYQGSQIQGIAFELSNHWCWNHSRQRTELFIHTRQPWNGYTTLGCIKLKPSDIAAAKDAFEAYNKPNTTYPNKLVVTH